MTDRGNREVGRVFEDDRIVKASKQADELLDDDAYFERHPEWTDAFRMFSPTWNGSTRTESATPHYHQTGEGSLPAAVSRPER